MTNAHGVTRRVLFVHVEAAMYGSSRSVLELSSSLVKRAWKVKVLLPGPGPLVQALADAGVEVTIGPVGALRRASTSFGWAKTLTWDIPRAALLVRHLSKAVDVVHVNNSVLLGALLGARISGRPVVWHIRESYADHRRLGDLYCRWAARLSDMVVANSTAIGAEAASAGVGPRLQVIHNGISFAPRRPSTDRVGVVCVGRINEWKGQDVLVDALAKLRRRGHAVPAVIAGDPYPGAEVALHRLANQIERLGLAAQVELPGFVSDVTGLLADNSLFVLPSRRPEPFGLALIEAMSQGLACIASAAGGPLEIVRDRETGLLVPPGDPDRLADAIETLWCDADLRQRLGEAAAEEVRRRFTAEAMTDRIETLYMDLLTV